eukprot:COSAG06_NODE_25449_length_636_cov_1.711359_1_plen_31_part_10
MLVVSILMHYWYILPLDDTYRLYLARENIIR